MTMARIELAPAVLDDFDRFFDHMVEFGVTDAPQRVAEIVAAVQVLASNPLIGRPVKGAKRELVIGNGTRGYVALYRYVADIGMVFVLAFRHQREAGFKRPG
jgi:plasmid stabilization system protein ParE